MRQTPPAHRAKIPPKNSPKSQIQPPFDQLANNIPQTPLPPVPLHSIRSAKAVVPAVPIRRRRGSVILSLPQYALVDCCPLAALPPLATFLSRRTAVSAATAGDVRVETHGSQLLPRYAHSRLRPRSCRCRARLMHQYSSEDGAVAVGGGGLREHAGPVCAPNPASV